MIRLFTATQHKDEIISLWQRSFGDSVEYITFFLNNCPDYEIVGYFTDDSLVSMFFMLNGEIDGRRCKYLYAACTAPQYRKQGIMEKLINYAKDYYTEKGFEGIFLVPANEKLYSYYSKFGFISSFVKYKFTLKKQNCVKPLNINIDIEKVFALKKKLLCKINAFKFSDGEMLYTIKEHLFGGGLIAYDDVSLAFFSLNDSGDIVCKEFLTDAQNTFEAAEKLFLNYNAENIYFLTPIVYNSRDKVGEYTKCGMCLPLSCDFLNYLNENNMLYAGMYLD